MANQSTETKKTLSMLNIIGLRESINSLMQKESKYIPVSSICKAYLKKLDEGIHEETLCSSFVNEISKVAIHESAKMTVYELNSKLNTYKRDLNVINSLYEMEGNSHAYIVPMIENSIVEYLTNKNPETRQNARQMLSLFEGISEINSVLEALSFDEYEEKTGHKLVNSTLNEAMLPKKEKTYTEAEVQTMIADEKAKAVKESEDAKLVSKSISSIDTHINLHGMITKLINKEGRNEGLKAFCEQYTAALNSGKPDELLYESFISGLSQWNYLNAVDTEMSALKDRVSKYHQDIDLKKILETMKQTGSYYIVPLIEGCVVDYINNKSMANRAVLKQRLEAFEYDPFVRDILNVVLHDQSLATNVYLGESLESYNNNVHTEKIFSPVKYIKENECVFNVKGTYYNRKGNTITKLSNGNVDKLDESFKMLCNLINHPAVKINDLENSISIFEGNDSAKITESEIVINGKVLTTDELKHTAEMSHLMNEHKEGFYKAIEMINENFDNIAYIDFVKRVAMNESNGKTVDVFRIKDNLFVTTTDAALGRSTFYRNVNPIQCRNYINEHMSLNVAPMFEDILPNQKAILEDIDETKKSYETYLSDLDEKKKQLLSMKEDSDDTTDIDDAIKLIDDERKDVEASYKKYQEETDDFTDGTDDDTDADSVDDVTTDASDEPGSEDPTASDDTPKESPEDMQVPIEDSPLDQDIAAELDNADAIDSAVANATPYDSTFDVVADGVDKSEVQVLRVSYDENIKTGKKSNKGTAFVVIPSVNANGDIQDETKTITFYLDADRKPIINNEYMPLSIYKAIVSAIEEDPDTAQIDVDGTAGLDADGEDASEPIAGTPDITEPTDDSSADVASLDIIAEPTEPVDKDSDSDLDGIMDLPSLDDEPMAGLDADPDLPSDDSDTRDSDADKPFDLTSLANDVDTKDSNSNSDELDTPDVETPAETADHTGDQSYPIELGLNISDIKPIKKDKFEDDLDDLGIEHSEVEGVSDAVCIKINSKSDAYALRDYLSEWKNYSPAEFDNFFPELKACFANKGKTPVMQVESAKPVKILGISHINESVLYNDNSKGCVNIVLPYTSDYAKMFGYNTDESINPTHINIVTENAKETAELYRNLSAYAKSVGDKLDEDARGFLDRYADDFKKINEEETYTLSVPFNGFLAQKLSTKGITFTELNENLNITLRKDQYSKAKKIFKNFYGDATPIAVKDFFQFSEKSLSEGIKITIRDDKSGKTIELDTDDLVDGGEDASANNNTEFSDSFKDTTFDPAKSALYQSDDDSSDEGEDKEDKKDDDKPTEQSDDKPAEQSDDKSKESSDDAQKQEEPKEEPKEAPKKKRFTFRKKTNESANAKSDKPLNESVQASKAQVNVYDYVRLGSSKDAPVGYVIAKLPMSDNFIVNVNGRTVECKPSDLYLVHDKVDSVQFPVKFDESTLKALYEQMVHCGMFMNGNRLTPNDCYTKYSEYMNAKDDDNIRIIVEGQTTLVNKKYIKITEDVNEFINPNDYVSGEEISDMGEKLRDILFNIKDYEAAVKDTDAVRVMIDTPDGERKLVLLPCSSIKPVKM